MSYLEPSLYSRQDCEYYGVPTGPEPEQVRCQDCWTWKQKGRKCGHCAEMAEREKRAAIIRELGMTPDILGSQHEGSCLPGAIDRDATGGAASKPAIRQTTEGIGDAGSTPADSIKFTGGLTCTSIAQGAEAVSVRVSALHQFGIRRADALPLDTRPFPAGAASADVQWRTA